MSRDFSPDLSGNPRQFSPDLEIIEEEKVRVPKKKEDKIETIVTSEANLVSGISNTSEVVTVNNLLHITQSHIIDDNSCREVVNELTDTLNASIHLMSIREILDYLKVKLREREFHVSCIFKAYEFIQKSEYAREMFAGSRRKERIIEATDRKRINGLLSMLNDTNGSR